MKSLAPQLIGLFLIGVTSPAAYAENTPWADYSNHIQTQATITGLGSELFGEKVDLYNGRLSFSVTDVSIPGSSSLPVALTRTFTVYDRDGNTPDTLLSDWDLDLPRLSGVFATTWHDQRCSGERRPPTVEEGRFTFSPSRYWYGNQAEMPGGGEMLVPNQNLPRPSVGGPYLWVTTGFTYFSCLPNLKNGAGEGFLAITADGTKYWFDWMGQYHESAAYSSETIYGVGTLGRKRNVLYATRVEDRFGNWVTYNFSNVPTAPARLNTIQSGDGRQISLTYNANGHIATASDGSRLWTYQYGEAWPDHPGLGRVLTSVLLPDNSRWLIDFRGLVDVDIDLSGTGSCDDAGDPGDLSSIGIVTHPSGALGEFEVQARFHGRSNVPKLCSGRYNNVSNYVRNYWVQSLIRKRITGSGAAAMEWNYNFGSSGSAGSPPGSWAPESHIGSDPACLSDACAGVVTTDVAGPNSEWIRYTFGNSYRYSEHKLLKIEKGTGPNNILRTELISYELSQSGQPFATPVGTSFQNKGDGFISSYLRPQRSKVIIQDGTVFSSTVNNFDEFGRPLSVTKSSSPMP